MKTERVKVVCESCGGKGTITETLWNPQGGTSGITSFGTEKIETLCPECNGQGWVESEKLL